MLIDGQLFELINDDFSENVAEKDSQKTVFHKVSDEDGCSEFFKSISDDTILYGFHMDEKGWVILVTKYKLVK